MTRLKSDMILLFVALIWGTAFVAQKDAFLHVGACTFVAARFFLSAVMVFPLAVREARKGLYKLSDPCNRGELALLCASFSAGVILQQAGIGLTTVTNAGFLTGLYVVFVPVICVIAYRQKLSAWIFPAAFMALAGVWLLSGGGLSGFSFGDALLIACAAAFALQVTLVGRIMARIKAPFSLSFLQYAVVTVIAAVAAILFEAPTAEGIYNAALPILYAGVISGGIAYTLQVVAQQYAPASDSAIILSGESVFAAIAGAWLLGESLSIGGYAGCALIALAIVLVEFAPLVFGRNKKPLATG